RAARHHGRPAGRRRQHPDPRPVSAPVGPAPAGGALLPPGRVRRAGGAGAGARFRPRRVGPPRALLLPRQEADRRRGEIMDYVPILMVFAVAAVVAGGQAWISSARLAP